MSKEVVQTKINLDEEEDFQIHEEDSKEPVGKWEGFGLKSELMRGIYSVGFETPSFIQKKSIPTIMNGKDLRAQAQSGTGKTGAFVIGSLQRIDPELKKTQVLVLASTREIVQQIYDKYREIGHYMNVTVASLYGGTLISTDAIKLQKSPQVVVGTTGRVLHMIEDGMLRLDNIKIFILDEADEMLKAGFHDQVKVIYQRINRINKPQVLFFSATYGEEELEVVKRIVSDPVEIDLRYDDQTLQGIRQYYVNLGDSKVRAGSYGGSDYEKEVKAKVSTFLDICKGQTVTQVMIFINRRRDALIVHNHLLANDYPSEYISSDLTQEERTETLQRFKRGEIRVLVTSGLCKRGIDVQSLSLVVCLDVPDAKDRNDFIHRVGRSGRYGKKGIAIHILSAPEVKELMDIADHFNCVIEVLPPNLNLHE